LRERVIGVVQHIGKQDDVKKVILKWKIGSVELFDRNVGAGPDKNIDATNLDVRSLGSEE